jgi:hypothetical protein
LEGKGGTADVFLLLLLLLLLQVLDATEVPMDFGAIYKYVYHGEDSHNNGSGNGGTNSSGKS